jgi:4-amino-4-deoxy-L-arabinose transferase-like glycosyltransferase
MKMNLKRAATAGWLNIPIWLYVLYCALHLPALTALPVFADEAIYIRWAQLIIDDPGQYFFFPLNDGKTPLFVWMLIGPLRLFQDPLWASRMVSVAGGLVQMVLAAALAKELGGKTRAQLVAALASAFLPFMYFHQRMALMDGWLMVWISFSLLGLLKSLRHNSYMWMGAAGLALGAALLTKLPAVLALPVLFIVALGYRSKLPVVSRLIAFSTVAGVAVAVFAVLKIHPAFPMLFSRGSDFLYPLSEVASGAWKRTVLNIPTYAATYAAYLSVPTLILTAVGVVLKKTRQTAIVFIAAFFAFFLPIALMGKVVYPRYLLPGAVLLIIPAALAFEQLLAKTRPWKIAAYVLGGWMAIHSLIFIFPSLLNSDAIPFTPADRTQYLTEWSSGHGIAAFVEDLQSEAADKRVYVATEGYFGTLPDGVLMYLHNQNVTNIRIEGAGQPLTELPKQLWNAADEYDRLWVLVNAHRNQMKVDPLYKVRSYCRPYGAPCLEVWDVTNLVK